MKHLILFFLFFSYCAQASLALKLGITETGRDKLIRMGFEKGKSQIESYLENLQIEDRTLGANKDDCDPEKLSQMGLVEAWSTCSGIPDYFFKDGSWIPNFHPRPIQMHMKNTKVSDVQFKGTKVSCEGNDCEVEIGIEELKFQVDLDVTSVNASSSIAAGEKILSFSPLKFKVKKGPRGVGPSLKVKLKLQKTSDGNGPVTFDATETKISLPYESMAFDLPNGDHNVPLIEILNRDNKLAISAQAINMMVTAASPFIESAADVYKVLDINQSLNQMLSDEQKFSHINEMINKYAVHSVIESMNKSLAEGDLFKDGVSLELPKDQIQDLINYKYWDDAVEQYDQKLTAIVNGDLDLSVDELFNQGIGDTTPPLENILFTLKDGKSESTVLFIDKFLTKIDKQVADIESQSQCLNGEHNPNCKRLNEVKTELLSTKKEIEDKLKLSAPKMQVKIISDIIAEKDNLFTLEVHQECDGVESTSNQMQEDEDQQEEFQGLLSLKTVLAPLKVIADQGQLDFCLLDGMGLPCSQSLDGQSGFQSIKVKEFAKIIYDESDKSYIYKMNLHILPEDEVVEFKGKFKLGLCGDSKICLKNQLSLPSESKKFQKIFQIMAENIMSYAIKLNPVLANFAPEKLNFESFDEENGQIDTSVEVTNLKILGLEQGPEFLKMRANFQF